MCPFLYATRQGSCCMKYQVRVAVWRLFTQMIWQCARRSLSKNARSSRACRLLEYQTYQAASAWAALAAAAAMNRE